jgi:hypothetical protein
MKNPLSSDRQFGSKLKAWTPVLLGILQILYWAMKLWKLIH